jgi:hypothetical protein
MLATPNEVLQQTGPPACVPFSEPFVLFVSFVVQY